MALRTPAGSVTTGSGFGGIRLPGDCDRGPDRSRWRCAPARQKRAAPTRCQEAEMGLLRCGLSRYVFRLRSRSLTQVDTTAIDAPKRSRTALTLLAAGGLDTHPPTEGPMSPESPNVGLAGEAHDR